MSSLSVPQSASVVCSSVVFLRPLQQAPPHASVVRSRLRRPQQLLLPKFDVARWGALLKVYRFFQSNFINVTMLRIGRPMNLANSISTTFMLPCATTLGTKHHQAYVFQAYSSDFQTSYAAQLLFVTIPFHSDSHPLICAAPYHLEFCYSSPFSNLPHKQTLNPLNNVTKLKPEWLISYVGLTKDIQSIMYCIPFTPPILLASRLHPRLHQQ
ncbi:hypothetical protein Syun_003907 [Stephania yunnanensis]|uniref:Uncharacterized protein n=1 Tax=Stephania yunnanensis TaxID=152371 RepID=A0AAP0L4L4_9MAGN